jgi:hypothetical protein
MKKQRVAASLLMILCLALGALILVKSGLRFGGQGFANADQAKRQHLLAMLRNGQNLSADQLQVIDYGVVYGALTNRHTGRPFAGDLVRAYSPDGVSKVGFAEACISGNDGAYRLVVQAGRSAVLASSVSSNNSDSGNFKIVDVAPGEKRRLDLSINYQGDSGPVTGIVYGTDGKPAAGVKISIFNQVYHPPSISGQDGRFNFEAPGLFPDAKMYAACGALATPNAIAVKDGRNVIFHLVAGGGCPVSGIVKDYKGQPVSGASVRLFLKNDDGSRYVADLTVSDNRGAYSFSNEYAGGRFDLTVFHPGYAPWATKNPIHGACGETIHVQSALLTPGDGWIAGEVVDPFGTPVLNAAVSVDQFGKANKPQAITDSLGNFKLTGIQTQEAALSITAAGGRRASVTLLSGTSGARIRILNKQEAQAVGIAY